MNPQHQLYIFIGKINKLRNLAKIGSADFYQRYVDDTFYSFSRNKYLWAITNGGDQRRHLNSHPYNEGDTVCNLFFPTDCVKVQGGLDIQLNGGETKIFIPSDQVNWLK